MKPLRVRCPAFVFALAVFLIGSGCATTLDPGDTVSPPPAALVGRWHGNAKNTLAGGRQSEFLLAIDIQPDGNVTGTVGDAQLAAGRFERSPGYTWHKIDRVKHYAVRGELRGAGLAAEGIARTKIAILLRVTEGSVTAYVGTNGLKVEEKQTIQLRAPSVVLTKVE